MSLLKPDAYETGIINQVCLILLIIIGIFLLIPQIDNSRNTQLERNTKMNWKQWEQYDRIAYACENGDMSEFNKLSEAEKDYFRQHFEEWEGKHCVCYEARKDGAE